MRLRLFIFLFFLNGYLNAQSYFNKRITQSFSMASATERIVLQDDSVYLNIISLNDSINRLEQKFTSISIQNGASVQLFDLITDSTDYYAAKLTTCKKGGFVDAITIAKWGEQNTYGVIKYKPNGDTAFFNVSSDSLLYIYLYSIKETEDSGFIITGKIQLISGNQGGTEDLILLKTDSLGQEQWRKIYGQGDRREQGHSIEICADGGYIISGVKGKKAYVLKTDSLGNKEWDETYGHPSWVNKPAYSIIKTQDGGYAFVGAIAVAHFTGADEVLPWIVKLNALGDVVWSHINQGISQSPYDNNFKDLLELNDGSLVICGQQRVENLDTNTYPGKERTKGVISKYTKTGNQLWVRYYNHPELVAGISSEHILNSIVQTPDGGFAAAGWLYPETPDPGTQDAWVIKVDSFGCLVKGCEVTGVPQINASIKALKIYPNPVSEVLNVEITPLASLGLNQQEYVFEIYDMLGKKVLIKNLVPYENGIDISRLKTGIYTYKLGEVYGQIMKQ